MVIKEEAGSDRLYNRTEGSKANEDWFGLVLTSDL